MEGNQLWYKPHRLLGSCGVWDTLGVTRLRLVTPWVYPIHHSFLGVYLSQSVWKSQRIHFKAPRSLLFLGPQWCMRFSSQIEHMLHPLSRSCHNTNLDTLLSQFCLSTCSTLMYKAYKVQNKQRYHSGSSRRTVLYILPISFHVTVENTMYASVYI